MGQLQKGIAFADGDTVTGAKLNNLVDLATLQPDAVAAQPLASSITSDDLVLIWQSSSSALRAAPPGAIKIYVTDTAAPTAPLMRVVAGSPSAVTSYQDAQTVYIRTRGDNEGVTISLWNTATNAWQAIRGTPVGSIVLYTGNSTLGGPNFDGTGLGIALLTGWALCNGNNGTVTITGGAYPSMQSIAI